jgi:hypothetical protein
MNYEIKIIPNEGYIHAVITGTNTKENVAAYLDDLLQECHERNCYKILIEEHLVGPRLGLADVFQIVTEHSAKASGTLKAVAFVDVNASDDMMHFAETVAVNRAIPVRIFPTVEKAESWISLRAREGQAGS